MFTLEQKKNFEVNSNKKYGSYQILTIKFLTY